MIREISNNTYNTILRRTKVEDLNFVYMSEHNDDNKEFIGQQTIDEHRNMLVDDNILHLVVINRPNKKLIGYVILAGLNSPNIELRRIVINEKGKGYGRETLKLCREFVFKRLNAHRFWLDVNQKNKRAYNLYISEGFVEEGILRECIYNGNTYESLVILSILEFEYVN